uniref:Uncharacterized protein n=1 Tax=Anguilla anguilla TaxID=7936 RepID=A0A0E9P8P1_ANGAN
MTQFLLAFWTAKVATIISIKIRG